MAETGYLLDIPVESVGIRLLAAALIAVPLSRLLLRMGIRQPRLRALVSLIPAVALTAVLALSWSSLRLPNLWRTFEGDGLTMPMTDGRYVDFAPMAAQALLGLWAVVAAARVTLRLARRHRATTRIAAMTDASSLLPLDVALTTDRAAARLGIPMPVTSVVDDCPGGACIHGVRRPQLLIDRRLVERLDALELEAVVSHELAHIKRRDNLTALGLGLLRDVFFFVPGSAWATRQLHAERELAADQAACAVTRRPGALASGLLKVLDLQAGQAQPAMSCLMPEMPQATVLGRVRYLVEPVELSPLRRRAEVAAVVSATLVAAGLGVGLPHAVATSEGLMAVSFGYTPGGLVEVPAADLTTTGVAFDVYRAMPLSQTPSVVRFAQVLDDHPDQFSPAMLEACRRGASTTCSSRTSGPTMGLQPRNTVRLPETAISRTHATRVLGNDQFSVFLHRSDQRTR